MVLSPGFCSYTGNHGPRKACVSAVYFMTCKLLGFWHCLVIFYIITFSGLDASLLKTMRYKQSLKVLPYNIKNYVSEHYDVNSLILVLYKKKRVTEKYFYK